MFVEYITAPINSTMFSCLFTCTVCVCVCVCVSVRVCVCVCVCEERVRTWKVIWPSWLMPAPTRSLSEVTSANPAHRACTQCYRPMPMGGKHQYIGASRARETMPSSGRVIMTGSISCVTSQCDVVGAGISWLSQMGFFPFRDYLPRDYLGR